MRNCRFKGCGAIHRFFIRKDNEHGICVAVRHPIPPYLPIRKGRAPVTPLKGCDIYLRPAAASFSEGAPPGAVL